MESEGSKAVWDDFHTCEPNSGSPRIEVEVFGCGSSWLQLKGPFNGGGLGGLQILQLGQFSELAAREGELCPWK